ncbi:MAG: CBS domain-containing protein [Sphingomonadales bacterium]|nr:CBS domain-containing protein [Sphingomonadales bacterium]
MLVKSILKGKGSDVVDIAPELTVLEATAVLRDKRIGAVLVRDKAKTIVGVLSERDIVRALANTGPEILKKKVCDLMTRQVVTCLPGDTVDHVMGLMTDKRIRHVPVVEGGKLLGIVSIGDVVKHKIAEAEMEAQALKKYITTG